MHDLTSSDGTALAEYLDIKDMPPCRARGCAPVARKAPSGMQLQCPECGIRTGMSIKEQLSYKRWRAVMALPNEVKEKPMNITLTVRGALEEDAALQEIVSILYRKASEARGEIEVEKPEADDGKGNSYVPTPKRRKAAVENPEFAKAVEDMEAQSAVPKPTKAPAVSFEAVRKAASKAINAGKRDGVAALLAKYGDGTLKTVPVDDYPALLAEIEAL